MKVKYDVKGVDPGGAALPKPGLHTCKVTACVFNESPGEKPDGSKKDPRFEIQYQITEGESKGFTLYDYIPMTETMAWKLAQFIRAMGLPPKGTITDDVIGTALSVRVAIQPANDQYDASAKPRTLLPLDGDEGEDLDADADADDDPDTDPDDGDDDPWDEDSLGELDNKELREVAEEFDVEGIPTRISAKSKAKLIEAILEAQGDGDDGDDDDGDDDSDDDELTVEALEDMDEDELAEVIEENDLSVKLKEKKKVRGKTKTVTRDLDEVRAEIAEELELDGDDGDDDDDDDDDTPDYEEMSLGDLKKLAKERDLSTAGTKKALIKRLEKDDEPF